ncbi:MAG: SDR family NAD(P)-dependent oxidoreductase [Planctomycetota bacterium]
MAFLLSDRTILVTGASAGIGAELARQLGERASLLVLTSRSRERLESVAEEIPCETRVVPADLSRPQGVVELLGAISDLEVEVLVNNAGVGIGGRFPEAEEERLCRMVELNVRSLLRLTRALLPGMIERREGAILNVGSISGDQGVPHMAAYAATKAFVNNLTEGLAWELRGSGVRVCLLTPGSTSTEFFDRAGIDEERMFQRRMQSPKAVAAAGIAALERGRLRRIPGALNRVLHLCQRHLPRPLVGRVIRRLFRDIGRPVQG